MKNCVYCAKKFQEDEGALNEDGDFVCTACAEAEEEQETQKCSQCGEESEEYKEDGICPSCGFSKDREDLNPQEEET